MIIQFLLTAGVGLCLLYAFNQFKRWPVSLGITFLAIFGLVIIWNPDLANDLAYAVGVSRGADLLLYCWIVISILVILNLHIRNREIDRRIARILRKISVSEPWRPEDEDSP